MFGLGTQELLVILVIVLILFGANRLPQMARSLGSSMKEFKKGINEGQQEDTGAVTASPDLGSAPPITRPVRSATARWLLTGLTARTAAQPLLRTHGHELR